MSVLSVACQPSITGVGLLTPVARDAPATWAALLAGQFIRNHAAIPMEDDARPRAAALAIDAAHEAVREAGWDAAMLADEGTALVVGTSKGPIVDWINRPGPELATGLAGIAMAVATSLRLGHGPRLTVSGACASGLHALIRASMMIQSGEARRVLVVATEASVHPMFVGSFQRIGVLPREGWGCRPFDIERDGFLMSEAAAAVCLEGPAPHKPVERRQVRVDRFALGGDATHLTGGDPDGALMRRLLRQVAGAQRVDLVHAHGTGTVLNDPVELAAIESVLPDAQADERPSLYSHKGALGHSLGAAGLIAVVLNVLAHRHGIVPPNVQTHRPLPMNRLSFCREHRRRPIHRSIALAAGFGGAAGAVALTS